MKFFNKKAIELAANTIVLVLVGVVIMTLAITLSYNVFCGAEEYAQEVDAQSQSQLDRLLSNGGKVQVADNTKTAQRQGSAMCGSSSQAVAVFTLGIRNVEQTPTEFTIQIKDSDKEIYTAAQYFEPSKKLASRETFTTNILIPINESLNEQQVYTVYVYKQPSNLFYGVQQLYVNPE